ncbi:helix-turn-helix domain-containing protein [Daejeonella lutea]|uniref:Helix-turn-helix domain-containing protein n=1 Tax=Daejeonella lutea TaxID=572036 RepID=A0A1T5AZT9_9SPHI|nr:Helix-turn-helix domain-containing protein [Daejeonella lutea]
MEAQKGISLIDQYVIDFVRKLRDTSNLSQEEIANIIGVTRTYITNVESTKHPAKYNLSHVNLLADYFNLSPKDFLPTKPL